MNRIVNWLAAVGFSLLIAPVAWAGGGECPGGLCGTPAQSGGAGAAVCVDGVCTGGSAILVAMTDRGDTYQFADDFDGDGIEDEFDNCAFGTNYDQADSDSDGVGDACDLCVNAADPYQLDIDGDEIGDACDADLDGDGVVNLNDNCARFSNPDQTNTDSDEMGDACDLDDDNDGIHDDLDPCRLLAGAEVRSGCDDDVDGDSIPGSEDNCASIFNPEIDSATGFQLDMDGDGFGDACDLDIDGDDIANFSDNCAGVPNPSQLDVDHDGLGDAGNWQGGSESCDNHECYVVGGSGNCLDPNTAFGIELALIGQSLQGQFEVGDEVIVALFSNRLGALHNWSVRFAKLPQDSNVSLTNGKGSATTLPASPQVANCLRNDEAGECVELNTIRFQPDAPGDYSIKVTVDLPMGDDMGPSTASYTIVASVEGEAKGGCNAAGTPNGLVFLGLAFALVSLRRRRS